MARRRRRREDEPTNPIAPPRDVAAEWRERLAASGFSDIEYHDGTLLGVRLQEPERAPSELDLTNTVEYYSRAAEWLHAVSWRRRRADRATWAAHCEGESIRDIAAALRTPRETIHRRLERLRAECEDWWRLTRDERVEPPPCAGRPRKEDPRREQIKVALTRDEMRSIRNAATRAGAARPHQVLAWVRYTLLISADSVGFKRRE